MRIKKTLALLLAVIMLCSCLPISVAVSAADEVSVYVATNGNDTTGNGTIEKPFATIDRARLYVRTLPKTSPMHVYVRGGYYNIYSSISFTAEDSGTASCPITYEAYEGEEVHLYGSKKVSSSHISDASGTAVASRVIDTTARANLKVLDLTPYVSKLEKLVTAAYSNGSEMPVRVYCDDTPLTMARYPDSGYLKVQSSSVSNSVATVTTDSTTSNRMKSWSDSVIDDLYIFGALAEAYNNETYKPLSIDKVNGKFQINKLKHGALNQIKENRIFCFMNLPEEISQRGECYYDYKNLKLYFYPTADFNVEKMQVASLTTPIFSLNKTKYVNFKGFDIAYTRRNAFDMRPAEHISVENCTIRHTSWNSMTIYGSNIKIDGCTVYDVYTSGIALNDADCATFNPNTAWSSYQDYIKNLKNGNNSITNCVIKDINKSGDTYNPAIGVCSFGALIANNEISGCVHQAIGVSSNDVVIEYNVIHDCVTDSSDMGAIYYGRDPLRLGTVIRYNYIYDIGNPYFDNENGQFAIYVDDGAAGADIYGNVFRNATGPNGKERGVVHLNGSQHSNIRKNIFIDTDSPAFFTGWGRTSMSDEPQTLWYIWLYNSYSGFGHTGVNSLISNGLLDCLTNPDSYQLNTANYQKWKNHYSGTIWENLLNYVSGTDATHYMWTDNKHEPIINDDFRAGKINVPTLSNVLMDNVFVNVVSDTEEKINDPIYIYNSEIHKYKSQHFTYGRNFSTKDKSIFVDALNENFALTSSGLQQIKAVATEFADIPFDQIGPRNIEKPTHEHSLYAVEGSAATCEKSGIVAHYACSCGNVFADSEGKTKLNSNDVIIPALGHNYVNGTCTRCGSTEPVILTYTDGQYYELYGYNGLDAVADPNATGWGYGDSHGYVNICPVTMRRAISSSDSGFLTRFNGDGSSPVQMVYAQNVRFDDRSDNNYTGMTYMTTENAGCGYITYRVSATGQSTLSEVDYMMFGCIGLGGSKSNVNVYYSDTAPTSSDMASYCSNATKSRTITPNPAGYYGPLTAEGNTDGTIGDLSQKDIYVTFELNAQSAGGQSIRFSGVQFDVTMTGGTPAPAHTEHSYGDSYLYNTTQHWQKCTGCDVTTPPVNHTITYNTTGATHTEKCDICGYTGSEVSHTYNNGVCVCGAIDPNFEEPETLSISCKYDLFNIASKTCTLSSNILSSNRKAIAFAKTLPDSTHTVQGDLATFGLYAAHNVIFDGKTNNTQLNASWGTLVTPFASQYWNSSDTSDAAVLSHSKTDTKISNVDFSYLTYRIKADSNKKITRLDTSVYARVPDSNGKQIGMYVMTPAEYASAIDSNGKINLYGKTAVWSFDSGNSSGSFVYDGTLPKDSTINTESLNSNELYVVVVMRRTYPSSLSFPPATDSNYYSNYATDSSSVRFFGIEIEATTITTHTHNYVAQDGQAPTCTEAGWYGYKECQNYGCTEKYTDLSGNEIVDLAAWKIGEGKIDALGHDCSWVKDADGHHEECSRCDYVTEHVAHIPSGTSTSCAAESNVCTVCGFVIDAAGHNVEYHEAVEKGIGEHGQCIGNIEYWECTVCGAKFAEEACETPLTDDEIFTGHTPEAEWSSDNVFHWHACENCGAAFDHEVHTFTSYVNNGDGTHTATCDICGMSVIEKHHVAGGCEVESGTCACGATGIKGSHSFVNGICISCGQTDYAYDEYKEGRDSNEAFSLQRNFDVTGEGYGVKAQNATGVLGKGSPQDLRGWNDDVIPNETGIGTKGYFIDLNGNEIKGTTLAEMQELHMTVMSGYGNCCLPYAPLYTYSELKGNFGDISDSSIKDKVYAQTENGGLVYTNKIYIDTWDDQANNMVGGVPTGDSMKFYEYDEETGDYIRSSFLTTPGTTTSIFDGNGNMNSGVAVSDVPYLVYKVKTSTSDNVKLNSLDIKMYDSIVANTNFGVYLVTQDGMNSDGTIKSFTDASNVFQAMYIHDGETKSESVGQYGRVNVSYNGGAWESHCVTNPFEVSFEAGESNSPVFDEISVSSVFYVVVVMENLNGSTIAAENAGFSKAGINSNRCRLYGIDISGTATERGADDTQFVGRNVSLSESVIMNYYIKLSEADYAKYQAGNLNIYYSLGNEGNKNFVEVVGEEAQLASGDTPIAGLAKKDGGTFTEDDHVYKFSVKIPAKQMTDKIVFELRENGKEGHLLAKESDTVKKYCEDVLQAYSGTNPTSGKSIPGLEEVVHAMLDYGSAAQEYMAYHTNYLANDGDYVDGIDDVTPSYSDGGPNSTGACDIKLAAGNINLEENIHLRLCLAYTNEQYLNRENYVVKLSFKRENKNDWVVYSTDSTDPDRKLEEYPFPAEDATPTKYTNRDELYYYYVPLMAKQMDDVVRIQVYEKNGTTPILERYYSINMYCYSMYVTSNLNIKNKTRVDHYTKLKKLCQATYSYGQAAQKYASYGL